jgi:cellulose synthase/poly-beta-1,6-N-acetylglucosamine synthase-like glycosyltransferase
MSDANSMYDPWSIRRLVRHFTDEEIGCVCGRLHYENPGDEPAGDTERVYWGYEGWLKALESRLGSLLGANGSIYAYRHDLFQPVDPLTFCDDVIPIRIALAGRKVIYDPDAWCSEETSNERVEMRRRKRHASFGLRSMLQMMREAADAGKPLILYQCLSHRVLRWLGGPALIGLLVSTPFIPHPFREGAVAVQAPIYLLAALGWVLSRSGPRFQPAYVAYYGIAIHAAGLAGLANFILGRDRPFWEPRQ